VATPPSRKPPPLPDRQRPRHPNYGTPIIRAGDARCSARTAVPTSCTGVRQLQPVRSRSNIGQEPTESRLALRGHVAPSRSPEADMKATCGGLRASPVYMPLQTARWHNPMWYPSQGQGPHRRQPTHGLPPFLGIDATPDGVGTVPAPIHLPVRVEDPAIRAANRKRTCRLPVPVAVLGCCAPGIRRPPTGRMTSMF
jgi:hypothetical protein